MEVIELTDSDENIKISRSKKTNKRKLESEDEYEPSADSKSDSGDEYVPPDQKKVKKSVNKKVATSTSQKPKKQTTAKERKPRTTTKKSTKKTKVTAEDINCENSLGIPNTSSIQEQDGPDIIAKEGMLWNEADLVAELENIEVYVSRNILRLFDEDNTIPFIARYRRELTGDMPPEKLREVKASYDMVKAVKHKAQTVMKSIAKVNKLSPLLEQSIRCARTMSELDHIYSPFKPGSKRTLAEKARELGLEEPANALLNGFGYIDPERLLNPIKKGLETIKDVELGLQHIIADVMSKDKDLLQTLQALKSEAHIRIETSKAKATKGTKTTKSIKDEKESGKPLNNKDQAELEGKFENYFKFSMPVKFIKPHQVLAVNRGESLKVLSVKIDVPDWLLHRLTSFCNRHWFSKGNYYPFRAKLADLSIKDSYARLICPLLIRQIRAELTHKAEQAAVEVFSTNLKKLLLSPPLRGKTILGIDPGYRNGCKIGITSHTGNVLATDVLYINFGKEMSLKDRGSDHNAFKLRDLLLKYKCDVIALGNGTACRETESYISDLIQRGIFSPLDVKFTIVSEQGASIYSCSPLAKKEFPTTDPNVISAVSLARRLQDPLAELVKVEPKHLGVGMYQHDVPEKQLSASLDEVVVECVSFVGVDVNTASHCLLRRIAGLNSSRAEKIIEWRTTNGAFVNRQQLKKVKGIGVKTFEQCAGFIRIMPETAQHGIESLSTRTPPKKLKLSDENSINPLDRTWIHPESYSIALRFITKCDVTLEDLGKSDFIRKVERTINTLGLKTLAEEFSVAEAQIKLISEGLQQDPSHDFRSQFQEPLFRRGITSFEDIKPGTILTGRVQNVTHFGTFVDIGVGRDALIPASRLREIKPQLGDRVEVKVFSIDVNRRRITLDIVRVL